MTEHVIGEGPKTFEDWFNVYTEVVDYDGAMKALKSSFEAGVIVGMKENRPRITELEAENARLREAVKLLRNIITDYDPSPDADIERIANYHTSLNNAAHFLADLNKDTEGSA